jgi:hypothetical protein
MKKRSLLVFAQRILRNTVVDGRAVYPTSLEQELRDAVTSLVELYNLVNPLPKNLKQLIKESERSVLDCLLACAEYLEQHELSKYDITRTGFAIITAKRGGGAASVN